MKEGRNEGRKEGRKGGRKGGEPVGLCLSRWDGRDPFYANGPCTILFLLLSTLSLLLCAPSHRAYIDRYSRMVGR